VAFIILGELRTVCCEIGGGREASGELAETEGVVSRGVRVTGFCGGGG
jgi:hypothetical protein